MSDTTDPGNLNNDPKPQVPNRPSQTVTQFLEKYPGAFKLVAVCAVALLVVTLGFTDILGGCGKAKVGGKDICYYIDQAEEAPDKNELIEILDKIAKFGQKGERAAPLLVQIIKERDEQDVRAAALSSLKTVAKDNLVQHLHSIMADPEAEISEDFRTNLFSEVLPATRPEDYIHLLEMVVAGDLSRVYKLTDVLAKYVRSREDVKAKSGQPYANAMFDVMFWVASLEAQDGELEPPKSFIDARRGALILLGSTRIPIFQSLVGDDFSGAADKEKADEVFLKVLDLAGSIIADEDSLYPDVIIAYGIKMTEDPMEVLPEYAAYVRDNPSPSDFDKRGLGMPLSSLVPKDCFSKKGIIKTDLNISNEDSIWTEDVARALVEFLNSSENKALYEHITTVGLLAWSCDLPGTVSFAEKFMQQIINGSSTDIPPAQALNEMADKIIAKKLSANLGRQFFMKLSQSEDSTVRMVASLNLDRMVENGIISRESLFEDRIKVFSTLSVDGKEELLQSLFLEAKSPVEKGRAKQSVLALIKGEQDPEVRNFAYSMLLEGAHKQDWQENLPIWEIVLSDSDYAIQEKYLDKLRRIMLPSYPYGYEFQVDPKPITPLLLKLGKSPNKKIGQGAWELLQIIAGTGTLDAATSLDIVSKTLAAAQEPSNQTFRWASDILGKIGDREQIIRTFSEVMEQAVAPSVRGYARLVVDRNDHTKSRIGMEKDKIKLFLRPRSSNYELDRLIDSVSKANKPGLGFLAINRSWDRVLPMLRNAVQLPEAELFTVDKFGRVQGVYELPIQMTPRNNGALRFQEAAQFVVVVPKGTAASQGITKGTDLPFDAQGVATMVQAESYLRE